ncbi:hypothetical protein [Chlamydia abortus]|uniref:hypothetical protein n=1 Tax=Chlamydia abortus TaxID=83555 RepID=UPI0016594FE9|nr:hypothetical protein [Chlamydia abortus]
MSTSYGVLEFPVTRSISDIFMISRESHVGTSEGYLTDLLIVCLGSISSSWIQCL